MALFDDDPDGNPTDEDDGKEYRITPCRHCAGEGCDDCDNTGVVYP